MGFTRYWTFEKLDEEKFKNFSSICRSIMDNMNIPLDDIDVSDTLVRFNGVDEYSHETFYFSINKGGFNFCKTNLKPYDEIVCGCLYIAELIFGDDIKISGDSDSLEDKDILTKVKSILRDLKLNEILE